MKRYTYEITNYPTGETGILANLLIYKNTVIGARSSLPSWTAFSTGWPCPEGPVDGAPGWSEGSLLQQVDV